jgi:hypothetical protein
MARRMKSPVAKVVEVASSFRGLRGAKETSGRSGA